MNSVLRGRYDAIRERLLAAAAAILIAWLTISFQAIKAALGNPVDALRSE